ncbi:hypothetical protein [Rhodococcus sp. HNM0569]|uniref:hypothetical protein n=1 Tax=Rhodococcus sp. HNM0569 TaxID=2716340 RepID=UPI00146BBCD2|nr:hypothetical protein [Rhodococcus sp. HNM0569]NLU82269.1 hypothetical protein [Rhodococcus sp. HNM0569]
MADDDDQSAVTDSAASPDGAESRSGGAVATAKQAHDSSTARPRRRARRTAGPPQAGASGADTSMRGPARPSTPEPEQAASVSSTPTPTAPIPTAPAPALGAQNDGDGEPAEAQADAATPGPKPSLSRKTILLRVVAAVVVVALAAATGWSAWTVWGDSKYDAQRQSYVDTARQTILNLTTIHPDTAKDDVDRLVAGSSGQFRDEFADRQEPFVSVVQDAKVTTDGEIIAAGYESDVDGGGTVLVAARAMVSSAEQPEAAPRDFRMRVTIADDDGNLTASKVEFVP